MVLWRKTNKVWGRLVVGRLTSRVIWKVCSKCRDKLGKGRWKQIPSAKFLQTLSPRFSSCIASGAHLTWLHQNLHCLKFCIPKLSFCLFVCLLACFLHPDYGFPSSSPPSPFPTPIHSFSSILLQKRWSLPWIVASQGLSSCSETRLLLSY